MKKMSVAILFVAAFYALVGFGAYQYIISIDTELAVNPSNSTCSASVPVAAKTSDKKAIESSLETRYRTSAESNTSGLDRRHPGIILIVR